MCVCVYLGKKITRFSPYLEITGASTLQVQISIKRSYFLIKIHINFHLNR